jgi:hypothetical protein
MGLQKAWSSSRSDRVPKPSAGYQTYLVVCPLLVLIVLWLWLFRAEGAFRGGPNGKAFEGDFAMFITASQILRQGGNPYDTALLYRTEKAYLSRQGIPITKQRAVVRVGNPPLLFWAMESLTRLRFQAAAYAWMGLLSLLSLVGLLGVLRYLGWSRRLLPCLLFALMPQVVSGPFYGNVVCLVFLGVGLTLALLRTRPFLAGMLLSLTLLKPPVALPIALLILLFHPKQRKRMAAGLASATAVLLGLTILLTGWRTLPEWGHALVGYSRDISSSPDIASLAGLYVRLVSPGSRSVLQLVCLGAALVVTVSWAWKYRGAQETPLLAVSWLWFIWFLATPYAHFFDEILLSVPVLILLGRNGHRVAWRLPAWALYLMFFSIVLISWQPYRVELLSVPLLLVAVLLLKADRSPRYHVA